MAINASWLAERVAERKVMPFKFAGHPMLVDGRSALYWPQQDVLIVSDLHLEKGSYLGRFANPIPHYDSKKTINELKNLLDDYQPNTLVSLGDSFHDVAAFSRMPNDEINQLKHLVSRPKKWVWILGNHDPDLPDELGGEQKSHWNVADVALVHEPTAADTQIMGHYHPKATASFNRLRVRGRCMLVEQNHIVMPAFGQYTGGLDIKDEAFVSILGHPASQGFVLSEQRVFPLNGLIT